MRLKAKLSKDEVGKLEQAIQGLYVERDGGYVLDVEGMVPVDEYEALETKLREFRDNNIKLMKDLARFEGVDPDEYRTQKDTIEKLRREGVQKPDDIAQLIAQEIAKATEPLKKRLEEESRIREEKERMLVEKQLEEQLWVAGAAAGITESAREDFITRGKRLFTIEDGKIVARKGDMPVYSRRRGRSTELLTPEEWATDPEWLPKEAPHLYKTSTGTAARNKAEAGSADGGRIISNDPAELGRHLEELANGNVQVLVN